MTSGSADHREFLRAIARAAPGPNADSEQLLIGHAEAVGPAVAAGCRSVDPVVRTWAEAVSAAISRLLSGHMTDAKGIGFWLIAWQENFSQTGDGPGEIHLDVARADRISHTARRDGRYALKTWHCHDGRLDSKEHQSLSLDELRAIDPALADIYSPPDAQGEGPIRLQVVDGRYALSPRAGFRGLVMTNGCGVGGTAERFALRNELQREADRLLSTDAERWAVIVFLERLDWIGDLQRAHAEKITRAFMADHWTRG